MTRNKISRDIAIVLWEQGNQRGTQRKLRRRTEVYRNNLSFLRRRGEISQAEAVSTENRSLMNRYATDLQQGKGCKRRVYEVEGRFIHI